MKGPKSYTGEDCCEFHIHGGPSVISSVLKSISKIPNCRHAEPGTGSYSYRTRFPRISAISLLRIG